MAATWRVLTVDSGFGARHLATSEAILRSVAEGRVPPTLRVYRWEKPAIVIGVGQPIADIRLDRASELGYEVLRRASGGTAVLHDPNTISFNLVAPSDHALAGADIHDNYRETAIIVQNALAQLGVESRLVSIQDARLSVPDPDLAPACFAGLAPFELVTTNGKLVGLAQVRRASATANQGMFYLTFDAVRTADLIVGRSRSESLDGAVERLERRVTDLDSTIGHRVEFELIVSSFVASVEDRFGATCEFRGLTPWELDLIDELMLDRYERHDWLHRR